MIVYVVAFHMFDACIAYLMFDNLLVITWKYGFKICLTKLDEAYPFLSFSFYLPMGSVSPNPSKTTPLVSKTKDTLSRHEILIVAQMKTSVRSSYLSVIFCGLHICSENYNQKYSEDSALLLLLLAICIV